MRTVVAHRPTRWLLVLLMGVLGLGACQGPTTSDDDLVTIDYDRFHVLRQGHENERVVLLDVRSAETYRQGHIPGAINIPMPEIDRHDARLSGAERIIVYADGPRSPLAPAAAKKLIALRYRNVYEFRGGMERWREHGGEVVKRD